MFFAMLITMLLFMGSVTMRHYVSDAYEGLTFYSLRKHTAVDFIRSGQHILLADSTLMADESTVDYSLTGSWTMKNLTHSPEVVGLDDDYDGAFLCKRSNLVSFDGKLLALWNDEWSVKDSLSYRLPVDYLMVTNFTGG